MGHAEIYLIEQSNSAVTVMAELDATDLSEKEFMATYSVASIQRKAAGEPAMVARGRFTALCDRKGKTLGGGQILLQHSMVISREIDGGVQSVLKSEINEKPEPVPRSNLLWYAAARKACQETPDPSLKPKSD